MVKTTRDRFTVRAFLLALALMFTASARAGILYSNPLPDQNVNTGTGQSDVAPVYTTLDDPNQADAPEPFLLGDQFTLPGGSDTITSFTIYEVGNSFSSTPGTEFLALDLYIGGPDEGVGTTLSLESSSYAYSLQSLQYTSINSPFNDFPIYAITFTVSGLTLSGGSSGAIYDFAIGAIPAGSNVFALIMGDPTTGYSGANPTQTLGDGFYYYFFDGPGGTPEVTFEYEPGVGLISNYTDPNEVDALAIVTGTNIPEPSTLGLFALGLGGLLTGLRRRAA